MANRAEFTINATNSVAKRGFDATIGEVLTLQLLEQPPKVLSCVFSVPYRSKGSVAPVLSNSGIANPVSGTVTCTIPTTIEGGGTWLGEPHSFLLSASVTYNDDRGQQQTDVYERIVAVLSNGQRAILPTETIEYDAVYGWTESFNASLKVSASGRSPVVHFDGSGEVLYPGYINVLDAGSDIAPILPEVSAANDGMAVVVKNTGAVDQTIGVDGTSTIDGAATYVLTGDKATVSFVADLVSGTWLAFPPV